MTAKFKMYLIYFLISFFLLALALVAVQFFTGFTFFTILFPVAFAMLVTPKPHVAQSQSGNQYGLKSIFSSKIMDIK